MNRRSGERPYYRHSAESDYMWSFVFTIGLTLVVGCMIGACIAIGWLS